MINKMITIQAFDSLPDARRKKDEKVLRTILHSNDVVMGKIPPEVICTPKQYELIFYSDGFQWYLIKLSCT